VTDYQPNAEAIEKAARAAYVTPGHIVRSGECGNDCACGECLAVRDGFDPVTARGSEHLAQLRHKALRAQIIRELVNEALGEWAAEFPDLEEPSAAAIRAHTAARWLRARLDTKETP
jgi:ferredoxin